MEHVKNITMRWIKFFFSLAISSFHKDLLYYILFIQFCCCMTSRNIFTFHFWLPSNRRFNFVFVFFSLFLEFRLFTMLNAKCVCLLQNGFTVLHPSAYIIYVRSLCYACVKRNITYINRISHVYNIFICTYTKWF